MMKHMISKIPLIGGLVSCSLDDHWLAAQELFVTLIFSMFPILIGTVVVWVMKSSGVSLSIGGAFYSTIENGELLIYATVLLAPIVWMSLTDPPGAKLFPSKLSHMVSVLLVVAFSALVFGLQRAGQQIRTDLSFNISIWLFVGSMTLLYLATVYHNGRLPNAPSEFRKHESSFADDYRERRQ